MADSVPGCATTSNANSTPLMLALFSSSGISISLKFKSIPFPEKLGLDGVEAIFAEAAKLRCEPSGASVMSSLGWASIPSASSSNKDLVYKIKDT